VRILFSGFRNIEKIDSFVAVKLVILIEWAGMVIEEVNVRLMNKSSLIENLLDFG